jgi:hypothetical protein
LGESIVIVVAESVGDMNLKLLDNKNEFAGAVPACVAWQCARRAVLVQILRNFDPSTTNITFVVFIVLYPEYADAIKFNVPNFASEELVIEGMRKESFVATPGHAQFATVAVDAAAD